MNQYEIEYYTFYMIRLIDKSISDKIYIGKTIRTLEKRFTEHLSKFNICSSKNILEMGECEIVELHNGYYNTIESKDYEKYLIYNYSNCINIHLNDTYIINGYMNIDNKDKLEAKHLQLTTEIKCDCGGTYRYSNKQRHFTNEIHMNFVKNGIVWIKPTEPYNPKEKIKCKCGGKYTKAVKSKHYLTTKHIEFMKNTDKDNKNNDKKDENNEDTKNDEDDDERFIIED
jgi:hypothetical protein